MRQREKQGEGDDGVLGPTLSPACFPLCGMTSDCCLSNWLGRPPIGVQACKVPLGYTQPQNKKEGEKERESKRERESKGGGGI